MIILFKNYATEQILEVIKKEFPEHQKVRFSDDSFEVSQLLHELHGQDLFGNKKIIFLATIERDYWDVIIQGLATKNSDTPVFWSEDSFPKEFLKKMPAHTVREGKKTTQPKENPFSIANELASGNGIGTWKTYQELIHKGHVPEALFGILWWKLKDLAKKKKEISPAFKKTLYQFLNTYSQARETGGDLATGLEKTILQITKKDLA